ncbi:MAG: response regulator [Gemmataceae bacterium]
MSETILIVDDEEPVRRTFREWLEGSGLECTLLTAGDAEQALVLANQHSIDLAILDWNLGAGADGLKLLEDLYLFHPDVVAIMITGYAHQATPLDAMRMGVRDYLDKNQDLDRDTFLRAVTRQLELIRPAKRQRQLNRSLLSFREAVDKVVPLVQSAAALNDPVPLTEAVRSLLRFAMRTTRASDAVLLARRFDATRAPKEHVQAYDAAGERLDVKLVPFSRSVAGSAVSLQAPCVMDPREAAELQPFEAGRASLLAVPMEVGPGMHVVLELFDKEGGTGFTPEDQRLVAATAEFGVELLRQALAERNTNALLLDAVAAALKASESVAQSLAGSASQRQEEPPPAAVLAELRAGLQASAAGKDAGTTLELAEAIRVLALKHGDVALEHCLRLVRDLRRLLDAVTGAGEPT